jgi:hypothetical protein
MAQAPQEPFNPLWRNYRRGWAWCLARVLLWTFYGAGIGFVLAIVVGLVHGPLTNPGAFAGGIVLMIGIGVLSTAVGFIAAVLSLFLRG